jgi:hypothetical protein
MTKVKFIISGNGVIHRRSSDILQADVVKRQIKKNLLISRRVASQKRASDIEETNTVASELDAVG